MTNEEIEAAVDAAIAKWTGRQLLDLDRNAARYFFFAGSELGVEITKKLHDKSYTMKPEPLNE